MSRYGYIGEPLGGALDLINLIVGMAESGQLWYFRFDRKLWICLIFIVIPLTNEMAEY